MNNKKQRNIMLKRLMTFPLQCIKQIKLFHCQYSLIVIGLVLFALYLWFRFLRIRLPKEIPFNMLVLSFLIILVFTLSYLYLIYRLIKPMEQPTVFKEMINTLFLPLEELNHFLRNYSNLDEIFLNLYAKISKVYFFYFCTNILPRMVTLIALILDIYVFGKFQRIYKVLYISIIPLMIRYFIYSLTLIKNRWISTLSNTIDTVATPYVMGIHPSEWPENKNEDDDEDDDDSVPDFMHLSLELFITYQTNSIIYNQHTPRYDIYLNTNSYGEYRKEFNTEEITSEHRVIIRDRARDTIERILKLSVFIMTYQKSSMLHKYLHHCLIIIYALYFVSWVYFLYLSTSKVLWMTGLISLIHSLQGMEDPFSGDTTFYDLIAWIIESGDIFVKYMRNNTKS